jgi:5-dehydro-2-deoxygluconokinase
MMAHAHKNKCKVWLDLDYRKWNWPDQETTRLVYQEAALLANVLVGNEEEFQILQEDINLQISQSGSKNQLMILKRGKDGCSLFLVKIDLIQEFIAYQLLNPMVQVMPFWAMS